jgi:hypothetical protein
MIKSYYVIDFSAVNCLIDIRVNDVSVLCMNIDGQVSTIIPVNNAILESGKQQISYNVLPLLGEIILRETVSFSASVWLYNASGVIIEKVKEINNFTMPENETGIPLPAYKDENFFYADVPYKLEAWQNSQDLSKVENLRTLVVLAYREIEAVINNAQYEQFAKLTQKREDNIAVCMYLSEEEKNERLTELIELIETGFKIVPVSEKDIMIVFGYDKLVTLKKPDGESALLLINEKTEEELNLEIQFHLEQGNTKLSII